MKEKILTFLRQSQGFVSGQDISGRLGISRTAVWKYINILKKEGYEIESVTRKGYRLLQSPDVITAQELLARLPEGTLPGEIYYYDSIDSTNEEAKRLAVRGAPDRSLCIAETQTAGKGRRGRAWASPKGEDIFFTLLLRPDLPLEDASMLTLVAALAAVRTSEKYAGEPCWIKWPNDIVFHEKKICGILTEIGVEMDEISYAVIGIGFNLNRKIFEDDIASMAASIGGETGKKINRAAFLADFLVEFMGSYKAFLREGDLGFLMAEYNAHLINIGRQVKIVRKGRELVRTALGINEKGELVVRDPEGKQERIFAGEVSVRGLYGYV